MAVSPQGDNANGSLAEMVQSHEQRIRELEQCLKQVLQQGAGHSASTAIEGIKPCVEVAVAEVPEECNENNSNALYEFDQSM